MSRWTSFGLLLVGLVLAGLASVQAYKCTGMGRKYCTQESPAHRARSECPKPCQRSECEGRRSTELERRGAQRDSSEGGTPTWEEIANSGLYDHVFVDDDEICLATCWFQPWNSKCSQWETYMGARYCKGVTCLHDKGTKFNGPTRYSGCHADKENGGKRKLPWHKPSCKECTRVFPEACFKELRPYYEKEAVQKYQDLLTTRKQNREMRARRYCYLTYFGPVLGENLAIFSKPAAAKPAQQVAANRPAITDDDEDSSDSREDDSSSRRHLLQAAHPFNANLSPFIIKNFHDMEQNGRLTCPAPQCLTYHNELLQSLVAPWYHTAGASGQCRIDNCNENKPEGLATPWCRASVQNCMGCKATWCPPKSVPFWTPVTPATYEPPRPFYRDANILKRFPRTACKYQPLTAISQAEARDLPWFDPAGNVFAITPRAPNARLQQVMKDMRDDYNSDLIANHERQKEAAKAKAEKLAEERRIEKEKAEIEAKLEAQWQAQAAELKRQQEEAEQARQAQAAEAARLRMEEEAKLREEQQGLQARELESAARQYCYDKYISEAARYGGFSIGGGLEAIEGDSDSEGSQKFKLEEMEMTGELKCPPAECYFDAVEEEVADDSRGSVLPDEEMPGDLNAKPDDAEDDDETDLFGLDWKTRMQLPWYYQTSDGFCASSGKDCDPFSTVTGFCGKDITNCLRCDNTWCPPVTAEGWEPATPDTYVELNDALELATGDAAIVSDQGMDDNMLTAESVSLGAATATEETEPEVQGSRIVFDYRKCTNSSVTNVPLADVEDLYWTGMIDFSAAASNKQGVIQDSNTAADSGNKITRVERGEN